HIKPDHRLLVDDEVSDAEEDLLKGLEGFTSGRPLR
ncbi:hypothetical protein PENFLA_c016G03192, partial [Penicillium flavigenum]